MCKFDKNQSYSTRTVFEALNNKFPEEGDKVHIKSAKSLSDAREMCAQHLLAVVTLSQLGSRGH